jgi:hypothetical protein
MCEFLMKKIQEDNNVRNKSGYYYCKLYNLRYLEGNLVGHVLHRACDTGHMPGGCPFEAPTILQKKSNYIGPGRVLGEGADSKSGTREVQKEAKTCGLLDSKVCSKESPWPNLGQPKYQNV